jgi:hypothetical protein
MPCRQTTVATHSASMFARRIVIVIAWRGRPAAAVSGAQGSGSKHLLGNRTNSQLLLPPCCIQQPILPFTFLCFRACILQPQPRYLHLLLHLSQTPRYLHSATAVLWFVRGLPLSLQHIEHLRWHHSLVTSRYHHVESITRPRTLGLATVDHSLLAFPFPFTLAAPVPVAILVPVPGAR